MERVISLSQATKLLWSAPLLDLAKYLEETIIASKQEVSLLERRGLVEKLLAEQHISSKFYT